MGLFGFGKAKLNTQWQIQCHEGMLGDYRNNAPEYELLRNAFASALLAALLDQGYAVTRGMHEVPVKGTPKGCLTLELYVDIRTQFSIECGQDHAHNSPRVGVTNDYVVYVEDLGNVEWHGQRIDEARQRHVFEEAKEFFPYALEEQGVGESALYEVKALLGIGQASTGTQSETAPAPAAAPTDGANFCPACGTSLVSGSNFCGCCGTRVS